MKKALVWILMFLLTGSLILSGAGLVFRRAVAPALAADGAPLSDHVAAQEKDLIRGRITELAGLYGFSAETATARIDAETLDSLNKQAALWWKKVVEEGTVGDEPALDTEPIRQALLSDPAFTAGRDADEAEILAGEAAKAIRQSVIRVVLPIRLPVFGKALAEIGKRADLPNLIRFALDLPWTALALSALLAGLIALLEADRPRFSLCHIGGALGGAGLTMAALLVFLCVWRMQADRIIHEASGSLGHQFNSLMSAVTLRAGILSAVMIAGGAVCLILGRRKGVRHG